MGATTPTSKWGPIRSILALTPILLGAPLYTLYQQFLLPTPNLSPYDPVTKLAHPSEATILSYAKYLSEDIGYRTPGTREHAEADAWLYQKVQEIQELCQQAVGNEPDRKLEFNAHLDSTLPSPGAADDALAVGVMLEFLAHLVDFPDETPLKVFNNAEESLQDGSHLYSTQHRAGSCKPGRHVAYLHYSHVLALINTATSEQMIEAYSHVPRPYGTIFANEIFSSGILLSDTDFRQFEQYLNVTGLDMAVVGNSYMYHMRGDLVENIQPGVAQHMADNVLALLRYLSSDSSPIPSLANGFVRPRTVFFSTLHAFFMYSFTTAKIVYVTMFIASLGLVRVTGVTRVWTALGAVLSAMVGAVVGANVVAFIMKDVLNKPLSWFKAEYHPVILYGPAAITGMLITQLPFSQSRNPKVSMERSIFIALLLFQSFLAAFGQLLNIGSSGAPFLGSVGFFVAVCLDVMYKPQRKITFHSPESVDKADDEPLPLWAYPLAMVVSLTIGVQLLAATLVVFVPLTGRIGGDAPAEFIIASIVAVLGAFCISCTPAFAHRFGPSALRQALALSILSLGLAMAFFYVQDPFDRMHQKRLFVVHKEDVRDQHLHIAAADGAPGFDDLVHEIAIKFGADGVPPKAVVMDDYNSDWDTLYPFSAFLSPYKIDLPVDPAYLAPWPPEERLAVTAVNDSIDEVTGRRHLTLRIDHPGIIWTVIAFDAHVLQWNLDNSPPDEFVRHHIKEASFYGTDSWNISMVIKHPNLPSHGTDADSSVSPGLKVDFIGIQEKRMWPAKKHDADGSSAMKLFKEFDEWLEERTDGAIDAMLLGCVSGETVI
ncbi:hypothetical protein ID866_5639 [Astraeus odoratus]|nr:hypothetical protein ID866_5639 [Astraeus odoratus]